MPLAKNDKSFVKRIWQRRYRYGWATAGVGVAALSAAAVFGVLSSKANKSAGEARLQVDAWTLRDKAQKNALTANILFAVSGAALVTSAIIFYREHKKETRELRSGSDMTIGVNVAKGGGGVSMQGRF